MEGEGVWNLHLRRSLFRESERRELQSLNDILGEVVLNEEKDEWEWIWAKEKSFTVKSFYNQLWFSKQSDEREEESTLHLFQGCTVASELWRRLCGNSQDAAQLLQEQGGVTVRNETIFEEKVSTIDEMYRRIVACLWAWLAMDKGSWNERRMHMGMAEYGTQQQRAEGEARLWGSDLQMDRAVPGLLKEGIELLMQLKQRLGHGWKSVRKVFITGLTMFSMI
ncbi:hypothetical protein FRX31_027942 [Thalictrum thalictroides]|uniref:Uncharacterized protein n=1 Tax=Thalictrum thalictroides TaxID=46969 RepID=A0A7J6VCV2_THATH|nr:hypothetical protein FRX31_027942 [Thalictrum thalictroides]